MEKNLFVNFWLLAPHYVEYMIQAFSKERLYFWPNTLLSANDLDQLINLLLGLEVILSKLIILINYLCHVLLIYFIILVALGLEEVYSAMLGHCFDTLQLQIMLFLQIFDLLIHILNINTHMRFLFLAILILAPIISWLIFHSMLLKRVLLLSFALFLWCSRELACMSPNAPRHLVQLFCFIVA